MQRLASLVLVLGIALMGYAAWLYVGETHAAPDIALATSAPTPHPPAAYITRDRADLRPAPFDGTDYTPTVRNVTTHRIRDGLTMRRFSLYDGGQGTDPRPVVVLFHGASRDELSMIDMWDDVADANGLLLVSLKSPGGTWDTEADERPLIAAALAQAETSIPVDRDRIFLFGHSAGAIYTQFLANRGPGPWRAAAAHAGTLHPAWMRPNADAPPIRHYIGSSDGIFPTHDARVSAETLAEMGHRSDFMVIPQHSHWFYIGGPAIARDAWAWFDTMAPD